MALERQINAILHHAEFQQMEARWRGLWFLVHGVETGGPVKIRALDIGKRELARSLRKFRGMAWDQSPLFRKIYEEEYGQLGGEPFALLVGDYEFNHLPEDAQMLSDIAMIAAAAHAPFIAALAPAALQMESWAELANPRDLGRLFQTPEYAAWRALRDGEDSRYLALCLPRFLARLPYGARTDPQDAFAFEEDADGPDAGHYLWCNAAYAMAANVARAFALYGWCARIRGVDGGGLVQDLPVMTFATSDGDMDRRSVTEIALSERREAELANLGFIALLHRKNTGDAVFISAQSLQRPQAYEEAAATANAALSARLPYLLASCRFAHFLKCMVRDKTGGSMTRAQLTRWLGAWLLRYVDGSPGTSSDEFKASHPLEDASVTLDERADAPGQYTARFHLKPHYQMEGVAVSMRLTSRLAV